MLVRYAPLLVLPSVVGGIPAREYVVKTRSDNGGQFQSGRKFMNGIGVYDFRNGGISQNA